MSDWRNAPPAPHRAALLVIVAVEAVLAFGASKRRTRKRSVGQIGMAVAEAPALELGSFANSSARGLSEQHPLLTLMALAVAVILLLSAGAVFTIMELGHAPTPVQPFIWFIAWVTGLGSQ